MVQSEFGTCRKQHYHSLHKMIIDTLIFDYGGVVADHYCEPYQGRLAAALGTTREHARELVSERSPHGRAYRLNQLSKSEFWGEVVRLAEVKGANDDELQQLWAETYIPNVAVLSLLNYLRDEVAAQTGIVMNEDYWRYEYIENTYALKERVSLVVASFEIGAVKPDKAFYEAILARARRTVAPERVLYFDDRQTHVDAAVACGMRGYRYVNAGELAIFLSGVEIHKFDF